MCGICGVHRFGEAPISRDVIDILLVNNQNRGLEATGVALQQADGSVQVCKDDLSAFQFVGGKTYKDFMDDNLKEDTVTVLGHTRKATKGNPRDQKNNHPMFNGETAVIHNGVIHNDDSMFKEWNLARKAETDSDIFRAILDKEGFTRKAIAMMGKLAGSAAIAAISPKHPGKMLLGRSGNPIEVVATANHFIFSSERGPIYKAIRPFARVYGIMMREMTPPNYYMVGMDDNSAWLFGAKPKDGEAENWASDYVEWHQELNIANGFTPVNYQCHIDFHGKRVKFYDDRPVDVVQCPNHECREWMTVNQAVTKELKKYSCRACGMKLG